MDVYTGPMLSVITKLDVLLKESILPMDAKGCLGSMTRKLWLLQHWFRSWSKTPPGTLDEDERFWLSQFREVFYDAKNLVDCLVVTAQESNADVIGRLFQNNAPSPPPHDIGYIEHITARATEVLIRLRLRLQDLYMYQEGTELVGIDGQKDALIKSLAEEDDQSKKQRKILCIVGVGGSGKTALAQVVYHQIKPLFDCGAFVTVSLQHSMKEFFTEMLRQLGMENHIMNNKEANKQETQLVSQIREILQNKRYLIVIDDLWNEEYWHRISCCLPNNDYGSRVIFTTRASDIVSRCWSCSYKSIYKIQHLGYIDSKRLFLNRTFGDNISCPISYTDDFDEILKMCGGTPSAIISIALLLSTEVTAIKTWQEVMDFLYSGWKQIATMQVNVQGFEGLRKIIYLIYIHLPGTLKDCLLYLAVHAKNQMIHRTTIVTKWIAEGFIHEYVKCRRQEVASQYFDMLVNMNFIQLVEYGEHIGKEIYLVNYMVLYVLRLISQEEDFATILYDISISRQYMDSVRLSIQCSGSGLPIHTEKMDPFRIRSITIVGPANFYLSNDLVYLRVLDLDGCMNLNNSAMGYICRMILLKYLSLKHTQVTEIPPDIGNLRYLETLDIRQTEIGNLPSEIRKLGYLETLDIRQTKISNLPSEIGELPELKTLSASHTKISCLPPEIGKLQNLETLDASHTQISCLPPEIGKLQNLETLDASHTQISCLPPEIGKLQNLGTLDVRETQVKELPNELAQLTKLAHLYFGQCSSPRGVKLPVGSNQMKSVKVLGTVDSREGSGSDMEEIIGLTGVRELEVVLHDKPLDKDQNDKLLSSVGKCENLKYLIIHGDYNPSDQLLVSPYFPRLERLKVAGRFVKVPLWLAQLTTLRQLYVRVCKLDRDDLKILGGLPDLSNLAVVLVCIPWKKEVAITGRLHSTTCTDLPPLEETCPAGFRSLKIFSFDCRVPWITFEQRAMPRLKHLHLKLYAFTVGKIPSGITNLHSLEKIILQYTSEYASSGGIRKAVAAMREEASNHANPIDISVDGVHEVFMSITRVDETVTGTEIEEDSNHGNRIELSVSGDHELLLSNTTVDGTITGTEIQEVPNHGNLMEPCVDGDREVLLSNSRVDETVTGTEIKECY